MRISDWSSDVCSSDLGVVQVRLGDGQTLTARTRQAVVAGQPVIVAVRPERISLSAVPGDVAGDGTVLKARVMEQSFVGARYKYQLEIAGTDARVEAAAVFGNPNHLAVFPTDGGGMLADDQGVGPPD